MAWFSPVAQEIDRMNIFYEMFESQNWEISEI